MELYCSVMACSVVWSVVLVKGCPVIFCSVSCSLSLGLSHHVLLCSRSSWSDTVLLSVLFCCVVLLAWCVGKGFSCHILSCSVLHLMSLYQVLFFSRSSWSDIVLSCSVVLICFVECRGEGLSYCLVLFCI